METDSRAWLLVRLGVAFAFLYPPVAAHFTPDNWIGYFPSFTHQIIPNDLLLLYLFGAVEVVIGLWILYGKKLLIPASLGSVMLLAIVAFNWNQLDILFRDLAIFGATLGIAYKSWSER